MSRKNLKKFVERRSDTIPPATFVNTKYVAKRPNMFRIVNYLYDHGISNIKELARHLKTLTPGSISYNLDKLIKIGLVKQISNEEVPQIDTRYKNYKLTPMITQEAEWLPEAELLFRFEFVSVIEEKCFNPPHEWKEVEQLKEDELFNKIAHDWGFTFNRALRRILRSPLFSKKSDGKAVTAIRRAFDPVSGLRIGLVEGNEVQESLETEIGSLLEPLEPMEAEEPEIKEEDVIKIEEL